MFSYHTCARVHAHTYTPWLPVLVAGDEGEHSMKMLNAMGRKGETEFRVAVFSGNLLIKLTPGGELYQKFEEILSDPTGSDIILLIDVLKARGAI